MAWLIFSLFILITAAIIIIYLTKQGTILEKNITHLEDNNTQLINQIENCHKSIDELQQQLEKEALNNSTILSQKKSSETKLGQISEHIAPFLQQFPYNPKHCQFLGMPIDFIVFNYEQDEIVFIEIKTGNAKESSRQKHIKNIIKAGRVRYEQLRIDTKGVKIK